MLPKKFKFLVFTVCVVMMFLVTDALSQRVSPGVLSPPGTSYPQPPPGAEPPVVFDSYQWSFENPEAHELQRFPAPETSAPKLNGEEEEQQEETDLEQGKSQITPPDYPWGLENPEAHELQRVKPFPESSP